MIVGACQLPHIVGDAPLAFRRILDACEAADAQGVQLLCFPECYLQGYKLDAEHVRNAASEAHSQGFNLYLQKMADLNVVVVFGLVEIASDGYFNSALVIKSGEIIGRYRKQNLINAETDIFNRGLPDTIFEVDGFRIGVCICNDVNSRNLVRRYAEHGAELLVCPSNNYLDKESAEKWKYRHTNIRSERAREAGLWLLSSDVTGQDDDHISYGPTSLISPLGEVVVEVPLLEAGMCMYDIPQYRQN